MKYFISFCYRSAPKHETSWVIVSEILGGIMWWWIFWNFWHEYKHLIVSILQLLSIYIYIYF